MYRDLASSSDGLAPFVNASLLQTPGGRRFLAFLRDLSSHAVAGGAAAAAAFSSSPSSSSLPPLARPQSGKEGEGGVQGRVSFPDLHQLQGAQGDEA